MHRLPIVDTGQRSFLEESVERRESDVPRAIVRAFLRQTYPLSVEGLRLRAVATEMIEQGASDEDIQRLAGHLPTVEKPHLELFAPLRLSEHGEERIFYTSDLANIQVTKGCSHGCGFCVVSAEAKVEQMPFAAVLQIAEKKQRANLRYSILRDALLHDLETSDYSLSKIRSKCMEFFELNKKQMGNPLVQAHALEAITRDRSPAAFVLRSFPRLLDREGAYLSFPEAVEFIQWYNNMLWRMKRFISERHSELVGFFEASKSPEPDPTGLYEQDCRNDPLFRVFASPRLNQVCCYYDSDPFDYKDSTFLHEDGTPADIGDVFAALATIEQPLYLTTAGWKQSNTLAKRAVEKIYQTVLQRGEGVLAAMRVSVNMTERRARENMTEYATDMKAVLDGLLPLKPELILYDAPIHVNRIEAEHYNAQVVVPIKEYCKRLSRYGVVRGIHDTFHTSYAYGKAKDIAPYGLKTGEHDVGACMPGWHLWPSGEVAYQRPGALHGRAETGARPQGQGHFLFTKE